MYKCCVFDLDGTLINTIFALTRTINKVLERFGYAPIDEDHTRIFVGDGYKKFVERTLIYRGDKDLACLEEALLLYCQVFEENCLYRIEAYDGMRELLAWLKEQGFKLAVLTNKADAQAKATIEKVYGSHMFDLITGERPDVKRKPDPEGALYTARTLGVLPEECLYLGDTNTDMRTRIGAGMDTVGVTWGFRDREELEAFHPKFLADHPGDVKKLLSRLRGM